MSLVRNATPSILLSRNLCFSKRLGKSVECCDIGHVEDVGDIADMPIGRNAIFVEDVEDVKDKTLPGCQADILSRIELIPSFVLSSDNTNYNNVIQLFLQLFDE